MPQTARIAVVCAQDSVTNVNGYKHEHEYKQISLLSFQWKLEWREKEDINNNKIITTTN